MDENQDTLNKIKSEINESKNFLNVLKQDKRYNKNITYFFESKILKIEELVFNNQTNIKEEDDDEKEEIMVFKENKQTNLKFQYFGDYNDPYRFF